MIKLACLIFLLSLIGCFSAPQKVEESPITRPFHKPQVEDFAGEYRLSAQHVVDTLTIARLRISRLVLKRDHTFYFKAYPCYTDRPTISWTLDSLADFRGTWKFTNDLFAFNEATQVKEYSWSCAFSPEPGPKNRTSEEKSRQALWVESYVDKKTGHLAYLNLYLGDPDSNDYIQYEPVASK
ncbi:MAG: hypothetical protein ACRYFX_18495 [Janthinobacterium lividum]